MEPIFIRAPGNHRRCAAALVLLLASLGIVPACGKGGSGGPSALLITLDTTRWDALGANGGIPGTTPHFDLLARESVLYDQAHTVTPLTMPAHASMLTGLYPPRHTVRDNDVWVLPAEIHTLAELARRKGIQTGAVVAALVLHEHYGLNQGFDHYGQPELEELKGGRTTVQRPARQVIDDAIAWLAERDRSRPFFLWVHLFDPHAPYEPPLAFRGGALAGNPYQGEVSYMDQEVGRLIDRLRDDGTLEETFVMVVGDHGEALEQHGERTHGFLLYEPTARVPFLVRYPDGTGAGTRSAEMVSVVDVFPTLAEALEIAPPADIDGLSLYRRTVPEGRGIYLETYNSFLAFGYSPLLAWMDARGKYVHCNRPELYDVASDPLEVTNLAAERPELVTEYSARLRALAARPAARPRSGSGLAPEMRDALRALGYVGALGGESADFPGFDALADLDLPSPAIATEIHLATLEGVNLCLEGHLAEAEERLGEVLSFIGRNPCALEYLALSRINQGTQAKKLEAIAPLEELVRLRPELGFSHFQLAICLWAAERYPESGEHLRKALELEPDNLEYMSQAVPMLRQMGRVEEAWAIDQRVRKLDTEGKYGARGQ
ncbi:MAG: sulfatase-like hydrolase/transferase [Planctomycetota bacterium]